MKLNFLVEGQTEETFVNSVLRPHLESRSIKTAVRCVVTSRKGGYEYRGGLNTYAQVRTDMTRWMKEERDPNTRFTTMFDLYGMPRDFPEYQTTATVTDPYARVEILEQAIHSDLHDSRFIPYLQLYEFEALILADAGKLAVQFPDCLSGIQRILDMTNTFSSPELIDDSDGPSKRIAKDIPEYEYRKASAGPIVVAHIGLSALRRKCTHFGNWIDVLESLVVVRGDAGAVQDRG